MPEKKSQDEQSHPLPIGGVLLPDAAELARRDQAEKDRREQRNQKFILRLQKVQARAQIAQACANVAIARLTAVIAVLAIVAGFVAWLQFSAAKQSAEAARTAAIIAEDTLDDSEISSGDTLIQMNAQRRAMDNSAKSMANSVSQLRAANQIASQQASLYRDAFILGQRAMVTIGRKDGVVADFIVPKDPAQDAEIVIYFQNSGHLPATFRWGTMAAFVHSPTSSPMNSGINYAHPDCGG